MGEALVRQYVDNVYTLESSSAWVCAGDLDLWIINGMTGISVSVFDRTTDEVVDAIYIAKKGQANER